MRLEKHKIKRYGWLPDTPDQRDPLYAAPVVQLKNPPPKVELRPQCPKVIYDQGQFGGHVVLAVDYDRYPATLHRAEFLETEVGDPRLFHDAVRLSDG